MILLESANLWPCGKETERALHNFSFYMFIGTTTTSSDSSVVLISSVVTVTLLCIAIVIVVLICRRVNAKGM